MSESTNGVKTIQVSEAVWARSKEAALATRISLRSWVESVLLRATGHEFPDRTEPTGEESSASHGRRGTAAAFRSEVNAPGVGAEVVSFDARPEEAPACKCLHVFQQHPDGRRCMAKGCGCVGYKAAKP